MSINALQNEVSQHLKFAEQRRLLSRVALTISVILAVYLVVVSIVMPVLTIGKVIAALAAILIGSLSWICYREKLYTASAATIVVITIIGGFVASLSNGGADGFVAPIMISAPVTAAVFIGARATLISAIAVVLAIVSLLFLDRAGFVSEAPYSPATLEIAAIVMLSAATGICASGVGYFASAMQSQIKSLTSSQNQLMRLSGQLDHAAHHDSLTGVANRQGLHRHLESLFSRPHGPDDRICLVHVDMDKFKSINDTYGHPVGDAVLIIAADIMKAHVGEDGFVARAGGDEFVIVSQVDEVTGVAELQERCDELIAKLNAPVEAKGIDCRVGASIGFVLARIAECSIDTLMTNADLALYEAKREGRGRAYRFNAAMRQKLELDRAFVREVENALSEERVCCVLQPQLCLKTGSVSGAEGLGRIRATTGELFEPAQLLPVLSEMGRLPDFDFKVMQQSLDALIQIRASGLELPSISINASSESLRATDYARRLCEEIETRGLSSNDVVVEILESTFIESMDDVAAKSIRRLRKAGIRTIMDDFGAGHATVTNLLKLNLDGFKVDRSLTEHVEEHRTAEVIKAMQGLANNLQLAMVVEGAETPEQFAALRRIGCDTVQGFGISRPLEPEAFKSWLEAYGASPARDLQTRIGETS